MNRTADDAAFEVPTADLRAALERSLGPAARLSRRASDYGSSHALEELDLALADGRELRLVFKNLGRQALLADARTAKPAFLHDPRREIEVYRRLLPTGGLGTAVCYATVSDEAADRHWLFLERAPGLELYQVGEFAAWLEAARWLARLHARLGGLARRLAGEARLLRHDADFYRTWPRRARAFLDADPGLGRDIRRRLWKLADSYELGEPP